MIPRKTDTTFVTFIPLAILIPFLVLLNSEKFFFEYVLLVLKRMVLKRTRLYQERTNKQSASITRESEVGAVSWLALGEGLRAVQLGKSALLRNRAGWIRPFEFRCAEPGQP